MRITATATRTGVIIRQDGAEAGRIESDLRVKWKGYHGVNTDAAEMDLEELGLGARHWIWNGDKRHYIALLVRL
jgi:hypothetical protein